MKVQEKILFKNILIQSCQYEIEKLNNLPNISFTHSQEYLEKINSILNNQRKTSFTNFKVAGKIILITILSLSLIATILACIPTVRNYIIELKEQYFYVIPEDDDNIIRKQIDEKYSLTYIPDGYFEIQNSSTSNINSIVLLKDADMISFQQAVNESYLAIDSETDYQDVVIHKYNTKRSVKHNTQSFFWEHDGYIFILACPESMEFSEVEKIIEHIEPCES